MTYVWCIQNVRKYFEVERDRHSAWMYVQFQTNPVLKPFKTLSRKENASNDSAYGIPSDWLQALYIHAAYFWSSTSKVPHSFASLTKTFKCPIILNTVQSFHSMSAGVV